MFVVSARREREKMSNTDFKNGVIVRHPKHGHGIMYGHFFEGARVIFVNQDGFLRLDNSLTGWKPVEITTS